MKKILGIIATIVLTITLGACSNNNSGNESSSESKIDKDMIQNMQGKWEADDNFPSTIEVDGKDLELDSTENRDCDLKIIEAKDGQWKAKEKDGDMILTGTLTDTSLNAKADDGSDDLTMTRPK